LEPDQVWTSVSVFKPLSSALCITHSPHTDLHPGGLDIAFVCPSKPAVELHCQWKWLFCKAQTMKTSLFNKKALVKAIGFDADLTGVTCKHTASVCV